MKTTGPIVAVILMSALIVGCTSNRSASTVATLQYNDPLMNVVIPRLALTNATIEQAVATIQELWREQLPGKQLPLSVIIHYINSDTNGVPYEGCPGLRQTISVEAENIKVKDCLHVISALGGQRLRLRSGMMVIDEMPWIEEDLITDCVPVSEKGQAFLGLSNSKRPEEVTELLASYGVPFRAGFHAWWHPDFQMIVITTLPDGVSQLKGLLWLVDNGYDIKKPKQPLGPREGVSAPSASCVPLTVIIEKVGTNVIAFCEGTPMEQSAAIRFFYAHCASSATPNDYLNTVVTLGDVSFPEAVGVLERVVRPWRGPVYINMSAVTSNGAVVTMTTILQSGQSMRVRRCEPLESSSANAYQTPTNTLHETQQINRPLFAEWGEKNEGTNISSNNHAKATGKSAPTGER